MPEMVRRFLVLQAFLLWQGGFVVYGGVVVPVGAAVLGSETLQGFITQRVTLWLNGFAALWCVALAWDCLAVRGDALRGRLVAACAVGVLTLVGLHAAMDAHLDAEAMTVIDRAAFARLHMAYLGVSTLHWLLALAVAWRTLAVWRRADRRASPPVR
jgi:hypothetical protein